MWPDPAPVVELSPPPPVAAEVHYGGPDRPPRALRDVLKAHVEAAPPGSAIIWVTYYFRDRDLADALARAQARGVRVQVALAARPREKHLNSVVISRLSGALGEDLRVHHAPISGPRLHAKIYAFLGPSPVAFVGSFNPSGDEPEDRNVLAQVGDQDRGHNLLVQYREPRTVAAITAQARRIWRGDGVSRLAASQNRPVIVGPTTLYYYPRLRPDVVARELRNAGAGDHIQAAVSHVERGPFTAALVRAAQRGARVELIVHDTKRRAPSDAVAALARGGVSIRRYCHPDGLPMHAKFVLVSRAGQSVAWFGSLNYNFSSRFLNYEILLRSTDPALFSKLEKRFHKISHETVRLAASERARSVETVAIPADRMSVSLARSEATGRFQAPLRVHAPDRTCGLAKEVKVAGQRRAQETVAGLLTRD